MIFTLGASSKEPGKLRPREVALPSVYLEGARVFLRPPRLTDYHDWARVRGAGRAAIEPYEPLWPDDCLSAEFFKKRLARQISDWQAGRCYSFLLFSQKGTIDAQEHLIGGININNVVRGAAWFASAGYWLAPVHHGNGYMGEGLALVLDFAFNEIGLHRMNASCLPENTPSLRLLERTGFREEGLAPRYLKIAGEWRDHKLFGLCAEDWAAKKQAEE